MIIKLLPLILCCLLLNACNTTIKDGHPRNYKSINVSHIPNAKPRYEPKSKYGNPKSYVVFGKRYYVLNSAKGYKKRGLASWYGTKFHKRRTSSGEPYDMMAMTAANKELPLPTYVRVTNLKNGRWVVVKVNDRGPFHKGRIIDLSFAAAKKLGIVATGTGLVEVEAINPKQPQLTPATTLPAVHHLHREHIYLQLGAFSTKAAAQRFAEKVKALTVQTVHIVQSRHGHHRVQIGPLANAAQSDALVQKLANAGLGDAFVVVK